MKKNKETILITGSNGFTAFYLAKYIKESFDSYYCYGVDLDEVSTNEYIDQYFVIGNFMNLKDELTLQTNSIKIFNLAGLIGNHSLPSLIENNVQWTSRFMELIDVLKEPDCFINIGSSAEYGYQPTPFLSEELIPNPVNNYGLSKFFQSKLVTYSGLKSNCYVINTRTFNLIGPGLTSNLVVGKLIKECLDVYYDKKDYIEIGRLDSVRDFLDVRDAVRYYFALSIIKPKVENINIASGVSYSINEVLTIILQNLGISPQIKHFNSNVKIGDVDATYADIIRLKNYFPEIKCREINESLKDMILYAKK